jgi:hypothetical protein
VEIHGGIALYQRSTAGGTVLSGRLLLYYNGLVLRHYEGKYPSLNASREVAILGAVETALSGRGFAHSEIRNRHPIHDVRPFLSRGWVARPSYSLLMQTHDMDEVSGARAPRGSPGSSTFVSRTERRPLRNSFSREGTPSRTPSRPRRRRSS